MVDPVYLVLLDGRVDYLLSPKPSGHVVPKEDSGVFIMTLLTEIVKVYQALKVYWVSKEWYSWHDCFS